LPKSDSFIRTKPRIGARYAIIPLGTLVVGAFVLALFVIPIRTWTNQRTIVAQRTEQFAAYEDINDVLQEEVDVLRTPQGTQEAIRSQLGYLLPSESRVPLLATPNAILTLPDRWPYSLVSRILQIRSAQAAYNSEIGILDPLQP
jgi:hypothetical protein